MSASSEYELVSPPTDGITQAIFANSSDSLLVSSWDKSVRLYDAKKNVFRHQYEHKAAVLDCCFSEDDSKGFSVGLDCNLMMLDIKSGRATPIGSHEQSIRCVNFHKSSNFVITGGWDGVLSQWDYRAPNPLIGSTLTQEGLKVYSMDSVEHRLVVGTSARHVFVYDVRNMKTPEQTRESSLMNQTRCVRCFPDGTGYALSSIEGRVAIEYFDVSAEVQKNKYAFKCHRKVVGKTQTLYPVNAIAFHPRYGTFATGGCDGLINVWDGKNKKRICQYPSYPTSISSLNFNASGTLLAVAASYTFEEGEKDHPADAIFIRTVNEAEVKPKSKK